MATEIIRSRQNARAKQLRAAFAAGGRERMVAIEGPTMIAEALRSGVALQHVFLRESSQHGFADLLASCGNPATVSVLADDVFHSAVATESPQGIAALVQVADRALDLSLLEAEHALVLVLDAIQDPGNLGTILRSADAFAATCVLRLPGTASEWNLKAMRASAGSCWRVPVFAIGEDEAYAALQQRGFQFVAAVVREGESPARLRWDTPTALLLGSEGRGLSAAWLARATHRVTLPMPGQTESLNAAVAASLLLYEASKQRSAQRSTQPCNHPVPMP